MKVHLGIKVSNLYQDFLYLLLLTPELLVFLIEVEHIPDVSLVELRLIEMPHVVDNVRNVAELILVLH